MFKFLQSKKGQGTVSALVFGIATLVVAVIIAFIVVSTLSGADLLKEGRTTVTVSAESGFLNDTTYTVTNYTTTNAVLTSFSISSIVNETGATTIPTANYTFTAGVLENATVRAYPSVNITYTYQLYTTDELSTQRLVTNMTSGVDNVSAKIPTVLLVAAIVLIMGLLVLLVGAWKKVNMGGNSI